jgi:hypothetical protein
MVKTRRTKQNRSPGKPYRNAKAYVVDKGDRLTVKGIRGRTMVKRVVSGARLHRIRVTETVPQIEAKSVGDRKPKGIFVGRVYTGVARSKVYPYRSQKRGAPLPLPPGIMAKAAGLWQKRKRVVLPGLGK